MNAIAAATYALAIWLQMSSVIAQKSSRCCNCTSFDSSEVSLLLQVSKALKKDGGFLDWSTDFTCESGWTGVCCNELGLVTRLDLYSNLLAGSIPSSLGNLTQLKYLDLSLNALTGSIPSSLGKLENLQDLYLSENSLTGGIPSSLGNLQSLQYLYLKSNLLTGAIPSSLYNLSNLQEMHLNDNSLTGSIPTGLGKLRNLSHLILPGNSLTGSIPSSLGNLSNLIELDLSYNSLSGSIPSSFSNITKIQRLDLSHNELTGAIPSSLGSLDNFQYLNLSSNHLFGTIPQAVSSVCSSFSVTEDFSGNCFSQASREVCYGANETDTSFCMRFCYATQIGGPCAGNGSCVKASETYSCVCNEGFNNELDSFACSLDSSSTPIAPPMSTPYQSPPISSPQPTLYPGPPTASPSPPPNANSGHSKGVFESIELNLMFSTFFIMYLLLN